MITVHTISHPNLSMFIEEDLSAASDPVFLLEHPTGIVSSFTVFSEMQFTSCPVYYAPSSSPLMVSLHLHNLESEGILCLSFLNPLPIPSLVLLYCVFFFFFFFVVLEGDRDNTCSSVHSLFQQMYTEHFFYATILLQMKKVCAS